MTFFARRRRRRRRIIALLVLVGILCALSPLYYRLSRGEPTTEFTARVLFSESAACSHGERLLVAGVMQNRIRHIAFGNLPTLEGVARQPGAFSCVDDNANTNWRRSLYPAALSSNERRIWTDCVAIVHGTIPPAAGPSGRALVYYHDKSITKPRSWDNDLWHAIAEVTTPHFVFYSIVAAGK